MKIEDEKFCKKRVGNKAIIKYYTHFKKNERIKEKNHLTRTTDSAFTIFFNKAKLEKVLPKKLGLI